MSNHEDHLFWQQRVQKEMNAMRQTFDDRFMKTLQPFKSNNEFGSLTFGKDKDSSKSNLNMYVIFFKC